MEDKKTTGETIDESLQNQNTQVGATDEVESGKGEQEKKKKSSRDYEKEIASLEKELEEQKEKYLRVAAEYDNYRKRTQKEKIESYTDGIIKAVMSFLPLIDNLERAQEYAKDDEGLKAILKQLAEIMQSLNIKAIESDGKNFDPNLHNAIIHEEDENHGENIVVQTLLKGYTLNDRVIRHAMVKVVN
ncbi:MAG: nucleotide exchange factor GrpE [Eubacteriales bacterium]|nr:nucleotide exchange factor GrpE [Eubacteriales bacterium]MDD4421836.1 nucleotide exchange factor GrpE [Eubacteriales bacterium]HBR31658.1 nucleotide exchange factor GrpE [Clostridiales bacterium]